MLYETVLFDLDATLVHTAPAYRYETVGKVLNHLERYASKDHIDRFWFEGDRNTIIIEHFGLDPDIFWDRFRVQDDPQVRLKHTRPYDDTDFLKELKERGIKVGIVTGAPMQIAMPEVMMIGMDNFNHIICTGDANGIRSKPDPHGLYECMQKLRADRTSTLFVGNGEEDVGAAKNAGVLDVLIDRNEHQYRGLPPTVKIRSLYELRDIIDHLGS